MPGVQALQRAPQVAGVDVIGPIVRRELVEDRAEVRAQRVVGRAMSGCDVSQVWRCVSTNPGMTMSPSASMTRAPSADRFGPTAAILSSSTSTSAFAQLAELGILGQHDPAADEDTFSHRFGLLQCTDGFRSPPPPLPARAGGPPRPMRHVRHRAARMPRSRICWLTRACDIDTPSRSARSRISRRSLSARSIEKATGDRRPG